MRWEHYHAHDGYYDFERVLYTLPDKQDTDVVMVLTFNAETRTAYYVLKLTKEDGNTVDWEHDHKLSWEEALKVVLSEGTPAFFPEELLTMGGNIHEIP
jgi:hypothetical protein